MTNSIKNLKTSDWSNLMGTLITPLRLIVGWQFLSTFFRRFLLMPQKMDPDSMGYIGYKFSHMMPHAIGGVGPMIEYLIQPSHATLLFVFLFVFSMIELLVGLGLMLGFFSRLTGLGSALLSLGILLGAGWLGPTCLDEWQIGVAGIGGGLAIFILGGGTWSLDYLWQKKWPALADKYWLKWLTSGDIFTGHIHSIKKLVFVLAAVGILITLYTNQAFYGGVYGKLHNPSKHPHLILTDPVLNTNGDLTLTLYRNSGPDTYGAFIVKVAIKDAKGNIVENFNADYLSKINEKNIKNVFFEKSHSGKYSLVVPLSAKSRITFKSVSPLSLHPGKYTINVMDVSGKSWHTKCSIN